MIKINNYFFEVEDYEERVEEVGKSRRSFSGKLLTDYISSYKTFKIEMSNLSPERHGQLLYLVHKNRGDNSVPSEHLVFTSLTGEELIIDIPINGFKYNLEKGEEESYKWRLTLEEVVASG